MVKSAIKNYQGKPRLFVNNKLVNTDSYITYIDKNNDYQNFSKCGFNLFSFSLAFHSRSINEFTQLEPFLDGIYDKNSGFKLIDQKINLILKNDRNAYIIPRLNVEISKEWENEHLDELNFQGLNGGNPRSCFSSDAYIKEIKIKIKEVVSYISKQKYAEHIIGYQIALGMTEEWMAMDFNGSQGKRSAERFKREVKQHKYKNNETEYHRFLNDVIANRICELSKYVKKLTNYNLVVGSFYGYTFNLTSWQFGHASLYKVINCKDIDFICSPLGYWTLRQPGEDHPLMTPFASVRLHNKIYFAEHDTRTYLTKFNFLNKNYRTPIWLGPKNHGLSINICKFHFNKALCLGYSYWWFDMWGQWFHDKPFYDLFKKQTEISKNELKEKFNSANQVAVLSDENAYYKLKIGDEIRNICCFPLKEISKAGVSYDLFLASDFDLIKNKYRAFILLAPIETPLIKNITKRCLASNIALLTINEKNKDFTSSSYRRFYLESGIKPYFDDEVILFENNNYLSIYLTKSCTLNKPNLKLASLVDKVSWPIKGKKGQAYLFKKTK